MQLSDFQFELPNELIARFPLATRTASRLMCVDSHAGSFTHEYFPHVLQLIQPGDLLVFNNTKVIPARLIGKKPTGGQVELLVERILDEHRVLGQVRASKPPKVGDKLYFAQDVVFEMLGRHHQFYELQYCGTDKTVLEAVEAIGQIPLPPYMQRTPDEQDNERYQTVYAEHKGSVAAPTAGLHFDQALLDALRAKAVNFGYVTLHIGAGTFAPVRVEDVRTHQMHPEYLEVSPELCAAIKETKANGKRVIAVGTTSLRSLEAASATGETQPFYGDTSIFIYPGYTFQCVDALITNLHLPGSTLLMLVSAFGGYETMMRAYKEAVEQKYRFYSYGDAMWINRKD